MTTQDTQSLGHQAAPCGEVASPAPLSGQSATGGSELPARLTPPELTPWFSPDTNPVREGVYEVVHGGWQHGYARWERGRWGFCLESVVAAATVPFSHGASQGKEWRGLAKNPAAQEQS